MSLIPCNKFHVLLITKSIMYCISPENIPYLMRLAKKGELDMFPIEIFNNEFCGKKDFSSSYRKKLQVPAGVDKNQYEIKNEEFKIIADRELNELAREKFSNLASKHYCFYCGTSTQNIISAQLHNGSGFNLWMYTDWRTCAFICKECCKNAGDPRVNYLKGLVDVIPGNCQKILSFEPDILIPSLEPVHLHFKFSSGFYLTPLTIRAQRTIDKFSLNRKQLVQRRKVFYEERNQNYNHGSYMPPYDDRESPIDALFLSAWSENTFLKGTKLHNEIKKIPEDYELYKKQVSNYPHEEQKFKKLTYKEISEKNKVRTNISTHFPGLKNISFSGIRGFENNQNIQFEGKGCKIIIGENGVGKSTLLSLLRMSLTIRGRFSLNDLVNDPTASACFEIEYNSYSDIYRYHIDEGKTGKKHQCNIIYIDESRLSAVKLRNFVNWLSEKSDNRTFMNWIARKLKILLDLPQDYYLVTTDGLAYWKTNDNPTGRVYINHLSSGYRSVLHIFHSILSKLTDKTDGSIEIEINSALSSTIVLIDEIELHLHPRFKKNIVENLRLTFPEVLFVMTTHDPLVIKSTGENDEVVVLQKFNRKTKILSNVPDHRNFTTEQILTSPIFGLSTTSSEQKKSDIDAYSLALKNKDWVLVDSLRRKLTNVGFFGKTYRELIALSAVDAYLSDGISPTVEQIIAELKLCEDDNA